MERETAALVREKEREKAERAAGVAELKAKKQRLEQTHTAEKALRFS